MDNLRRSIEILFCKTSPEFVLQNYMSLQSDDLSKNINKKQFIDIAETMTDSESCSELEHVFNLIEGKWEKPPDSYSIAKERYNVFYVLLQFANEILTEECNRPVCKFEQLLKWRDLSYKLGEDIFTTSFFAYKDLASKRGRHYFSWSPTINTDNRTLKNMMQKGLVDLHLHLFGSSLNFDISWLSLMNDITGRKDDFKEISSFRAPDHYIWDNSRPLSLYALYIKAFAIRQLLFSAMTKNFPCKCSKDDCENIDSSRTSIFYKSILDEESEEVLQTYIGDLQKECNTLRYFYGKKYGSYCVDYAIRNPFSEKDYEPNSYLNTVLSGERWLMYKMFSLIYSNREGINRLMPLFYAYLIIKSRLRRELTQVNRYPGFVNFQKYQNRKMLFIKDDSVYSRLLASLAVNNMLYNQDVRYLEARLSPCDTVAENQKFIADLDHIIQSKEFLSPNLKNRDNRDKYYYIFHFIKTELQRTSDVDILSFVKARHSVLRKRVKEQAMSINIIMKQSHKTFERLAGIDATNKEIGCRPEVFAQAYRYLKLYSYENNDYILENQKRSKMGFTYHVGEDFLDISDGLRAMDEVVKFLNFGRGDRIGHGLALGIDPKNYYFKKKYHIILPVQDLLDNVVWLLIQIKKYNLIASQSLILELRAFYWKLIQEIYGGQIYNVASTEIRDLAEPSIKSIYKLYNDAIHDDKKEYTYVDVFKVLKHIYKISDILPKYANIDAISIPPDVYYQSWLLRGDDPYLYFDHQILNEYYSFNPITFWERCGLNYAGNEYYIARKNNVARSLYKAYHFSPKVKSEGAKEIEFKVSQDYIKLISDIQEAMRVELARKHIAIETNPTSNFLIGSYLRYADLPIFKFYNLGLTTDSQEIKSCSQLSISINTDDMGVFSTNLENEYALMAIALEKEKNKDGSPKYASRMIYDWLERIREMGFEQRFR